VGGCGTREDNGGGAPMQPPTVGVARLAPSLRQLRRRSAACNPHASCCPTHTPCSFCLFLVCSVALARSPTVPLAPPWVVSVGHAVAPHPPAAGVTCCSCVVTLAGGLASVLASGAADDWVTCLPRGGRRTSQSRSVRNSSLAPRRVLTTISSLLGAIPPPLEPAPFPSHPHLHSLW